MVEFLQRRKWIVEWVLIIIDHIGDISLIAGALLLGMWFSTTPNGREFISASNTELDLLALYGVALSVLSAAIYRLIDALAERYNIIEECEHGKPKEGLALEKS